METDHEEDNVDEHKNVVMKYIKVAFLSNPFYQYFQFGAKINKIFDELEKT